MCAQQQRRRAVARGVAGGYNAATGGMLGSEKLRDYRGVKGGLVAEGDERGLERAGELPKGGNASTNGCGHTLGPSSVFDDDHRQSGEGGPDFFGVGTQDNDDRPGPGSECGLRGAGYERLAVEKKELLG